MQAKRNALIAVVAAHLDPADRKHAKSIVDTFCDLSPPMTRPPMIHLITVRKDGLQGGETRKPENLRLNWHRFVREWGDIVLTAAGFVAAPILIPFAALSLWNKYWTHASIALTREQATSLLAMWTSKNERNRISKPDAIAAINDLHTVFKLPLIDDVRFNVIERDLIHLQCNESDNDEIWLKEWVKTTHGKN